MKTLQPPLRRDIEPELYNSVSISKTDWLPVV